MILTVFKSDWLLDLTNGCTSGDCRPGFGLAVSAVDDPDDLNLLLPFINSNWTLYGDA